VTADRQIVAAIAGADLPRPEARDAEVDIVGVTARDAEIAIEAFRRFGKGHHPAGLNIGDCFAYALAKGTGHKLLFKGGDFGQTDIVPALTDEADRQS